MPWEAVVSHQLKTPLCAMQAQLEQTAEVDPSRMLRDVQRMLRLIDQLHLAGLCSAGRVRMDAAPLGAAAAAVCRRLVPLVLDRGLRLSFRRPPDDPLVMMDPALAEEAICNLLENAIKYARPGGAITVAVTGGGRVHVLDDGPGVAPADRGRIFEPFARGANAGRLPGSGLGLSLAANIMSVHRGRATHAPRRGGGAAFTLHFRPAAGAVPQAPAPRPAPVPAPLPGAALRRARAGALAGRLVARVRALSSARVHRPSAPPGRRQ